MAAADPTAHPLISAAPRGQRPPAAPPHKSSPFFPAQCAWRAGVAEWGGQGMTPRAPTRLRPCREHTPRWRGQEEGGGRASGCKGARRGPVPPWLMGAMGGALGTSPAASRAKTRWLPRSSLLTLRELFLAFGGLLLPFPAFVTERKPLGSNRISPTALVKAKVILTPFLHAKVTVKKS